MLYVQRGKGSRCHQSNPLGGCEALVCARSMGGLRGIRRGSALCGRSVEEVREEQKSVLSNRGARTAVPGFGSPVARFASLPWGCPILSHSGQSASFQHTQALSSIFASNFLSSFPRLAIEERWRGVAPRYALPSPGRSGGGGCEAPVCARSMGRAARDTTGFRAVRQECGGGSRGTKKCPEQPGRPGRLPGFGFPVARPACLPLALHPQSLRTSGIIQRAQALSSTEKH